MGFGTFLKRVTGIQGYEDRNKAKAIVDHAIEKYSIACKETENRRKALNEHLTELTQLRLKSVKEIIGSFITHLKDMQQSNKDKTYEFLEAIDIKNDTIQNMEYMSESASDILKTTIASGTVGAIALAGVPTAVTSTIGILATASTGTAISSLSGVAASNAILAWLGGGSIVAGGGGVAAGAALLSTITIGATGILAIFAAGMIASSHYSQKLTEATNRSMEVDKAVAQMEKAWIVMENIGKRVLELRTITIHMHERANKEMKYMIPLVADFEINDEYQIETFQRVGLFVKSIGDLATIAVINSSGEMSDNFSLEVSRVKTVLLSQKS